MNEFEFLLVFTGQEVSLDCNSSSGATWMKDGQTINHKGNVYVMQSMKEEQGGEYVCWGWNVHGARFSAKVRVIVGGGESA